MKQNSDDSEPPASVRVKEDLLNSHAKTAVGHDHEQLCLRELVPKIRCFELSMPDYLAEYCFPDSNRTEDEAICTEDEAIYSPSRSVSHDVSEDETQETNFTQKKVFSVTGSVGSRDFPSSDCSSNSLPPTCMDMKRIRGKPYLEDSEKLSLVNALHNGFQKSGIRSPKSSMPKRQFKGSKQQHAMAKPLQKFKEHVDDSGIGPNMNLDYECSLNVPTPSIDALGGHGISDVLAGSREECTAGYDAAKKRESGASNHLRTHLLAWLGGLVVRALHSQLNFFYHIILSMMLAWYHSFLFALHPLSYFFPARAKAPTVYRAKKYGNKGLDIQSQEKALVLRSMLLSGSRKLTFGILTTFYTLSMLTCMFLLSLMVGFHIVNGLVEDPVHLYEYLFFDYTKQLPLASLDLANYLTYPRSGNLLRRLSPHSRNFHATVYLTVPESDFNKELGIFQVTAELVSATGQILLSKTQPCMLQFRSTALQNFKAFFNTIPLLAGLYLETQTLVVSSFSWQEQRSFSSAVLRVVMAPRAGRPLLTGVPELYEAGVAVESEIPLWMIVIGNLRWTLSVWLGLVLFIGSIGIILSLFIQLILPDSGHLLSMISKRLRKRGSFKVNAACCHKHKRKPSDSNVVLRWCRVNKST